MFEYRYTQGYRQNIAYKTTDENDKPKDIWLYYLKNLENPKAEDTIQLQSPETISGEPEKSTEPLEGPKQLTLFER